MSMHSWHVLSVFSRSKFETKVMSQKKVRELARKFLVSKGHEDSTIKKLFNPKGSKIMKYNQKDICDAMILRSFLARVLSLYEKI